MQSFNELDLPQPLARALAKMEFHVPTPIQAATIPAALEGRDILGSAQTGTGKTASFGIPLLANLYPKYGRQALVLAPTRELAAQILKVLQEISAETDMTGVLLVGGENFRTQLDKLSRKPDYIVATPGRLIDHLENGGLKLNKVDILVLDEVDRMVDMGFWPQVMSIMKFVPEKRQTMLFSATLPPEIERALKRFINDPVKVTIGHTTRPIEQIKEETVETSHARKTEVLLKELKAREGRILVFVGTKDRAEHLVRVLEREGHDVVCLHGDRRQEQRKQALNRFREGSHRVMVATDLAARGIDVDDIEHVINYDLPNTREDYIHRIGRTGRSGKTGIAVNFLTPGDLMGELVIHGDKLPIKTAFRSRRR